MDTMDKGRVYPNPCDAAARDATGIARDETEGLELEGRIALPGVLLPDMIMRVLIATRASRADIGIRRRHAGEGKNRASTRTRMRGRYLIGRPLYQT